MDSEQAKKIVSDYESNECTKCPGSDSPETPYLIKHSTYMEYEYLCSEKCLRDAMNYYLAKSILCVETDKRKRLISTSFYINLNNIQGGEDKDIVYYTYG